MYLHEILNVVQDDDLIKRKSNDLDKFMKIEIIKNNKNLFSYSDVLSDDWELFRII